MQQDNRTAAGLGAALFFAVGLWIVATEGLTTALVPTAIGFAILALAWDHERVLRRAGVFLGSIVAMAWVLNGLDRSRWPTETPWMTSSQEGGVATATGFVDFLVALVGFDFGASPYYQEATRGILLQRLPATVGLLLYALVFAAVVVGVLWWFSREYSEYPLVDAVAHLGSGLSPLVWISGFILLAVATDVGSTTFGSANGGEVGILGADALRSYFFPAMALALPLAGHAVRELRATDGGWAGGRVATLSAHWIHLSYLVGAIVVIEASYAINGVGRLWTSGIFNRDLLLTVAAAFALTLVGLFALLIRDALATAVRREVWPWTDGQARAHDASQPARSDGLSVPPSLSDALRDDRKAMIGAALLGLSVLLALYGTVADSPGEGATVPPRTPGFGDLAVALGSVLHVAALAVVVAGVVGVPLGVLLRREDQIRAAVGDVLRMVAALPLLVLVYHLLPVLVEYGIVGSRGGPGSFAVAIGVAVAPYVALSTADLVAGRAGPATAGRSTDRQQATTPGAGRPPNDRGQPPRDGHGAARASARANPARSGTRGGQSGQGGRGSRSGPTGRGHGGRPGGRGDRARRAAGPRGPREQTDLSAYVPAAIPLCVSFGYAAFLFVGYTALGLGAPTDYTGGLTYLLTYLRDFGLTGEKMPYLLLVAVVGLPALGANLLADGLRNVLDSGGTIDRRDSPDERPRKADPRSGRSRGEPQPGGQGPDGQSNRRAPDQRGSGGTRTGGDASQSGHTPRSRNDGSPRNGNDSSARHGNDDTDQGPDDGPVR